MSGKKIDRYEIIARLGTSPRGVTWRARDPQLGRDVVLREYAPKRLAVRPEAARAAVFERVLAFLEIGDAAYVVSEFVDGEPLDVRAKRQPLTPAELDALVWPLADGLQQLHAAGHVQGGIDAAHLLLQPNGRPTLIGLNRQNENNASLADRIRADVSALCRAVRPALPAKGAGFAPAIVAALDRGAKAGFADVAAFKAALGERPIERKLVTSTPTATPRRLPVATIAAAALCLGIVAIAGWLIAPQILPAGGSRYVGTLRLGNTALRRTEITVVRGVGKGSATDAACGAIGLVLDVAETGAVSGRASGYDATCAPRPFGVAGQVQDGTLSLALKCDTCPESLTGNIYRLESPPAGFDGTWSVTHDCPSVEGAKGYTRRYAMIVKDGYGVIQWQTPGQPNSLKLEGQIRADGLLQMEGVGLTGATQYNMNGMAAGEPFAYTFVGRLQGRSGRLTDPGNRHCTLNFAKE